MIKKKRKQKTKSPILSLEHNHIALKKQDQKLASDLKMTPAGREIMTSHVSTGSRQA